MNTSINQPGHHQNSTHLALVIFLIGVSAIRIFAQANLAQGQASAPVPNGWGAISADRRAPRPEPFPVARISPAEVRL